MRKQVKIADLMPHPDNDYYFDRMEESKWGDFKESIQKNGLYEPPIVTPENLIVSGHERVRACLELGVDEIEVIERAFGSDDEILICLIETNIQQRGSIGGSVIKMARRIQALERCYGIKHGNNATGGGEIISCPKTQEQLAVEFGMTQRNLRMIRNLADLPEEFQQMIEDKRITPTAAAKLIVGLTSNEKDELLKYLSENDDSVQRFTEVQIADYVKAIKAIEERVKDFQELSTGDNEDYLRLVDEKEKMRSEAEKSLAEAEYARQLLKDAKKELSEARKQASLYDQVKEELDQTYAELKRLQDHGTTVAQVTQSLSGVLNVVNGITKSEMPGKAKQKDADKITALISSISEGLEAIRAMVVRHDSPDRAIFC